MNQNLQLTRLLTRKDALNHSQLDVGPQAAPAPGEALLKINRVAITTNNITYAAFGDAMQYWGFFPHPPAAVGPYAGLGLCRCGGVHRGRRGGG